MYTVNTQFRKKKFKYGKNPKTKRESSNPNLFYLQNKYTWLASYYMYDPFLMSFVINTILESKLI